MKGMIFTGESIPAIWDGRKTQDRRAMKIPIADDVIGFFRDTEGYWCLRNSFGAARIGKSPYQPGEIVYVKETWAEIGGKYIYRASDYEDLWYCDNCERIVEPEEVTFIETHDIRQGGCGDYVGDLPPIKWRSPLYMPRAAARLFLLIKSVRAERLQDITEEDARAEGASKTVWFIPYGKENDDRHHVDISGLPGFPDERASYRNGFATLWDSLNAKRGYPWESNPWVWVYEFERTEVPS